MNAYFGVLYAVVGTAVLMIIAAEINRSNRKSKVNSKRMYKGGAK